MRLHYIIVGSIKMGRLSAEEKQFYKDNGYILIQNLFTDQELEELSTEYDDLFRRKNQAKTESSWVGSDETNRKSDSPYTVSNKLIKHVLLTYSYYFRKLI